MKVAIYARVSTEEQGTEGYSVGAQVEACRRYAQGKGWEIAAEFIDPGISGRTDDRPQFKAMIAAVQAGLVQVVLVHKLDRFSRSLLDTLRYFELFSKKGVTFCSLSENMDFTTPIGGVVLATLGAFAQYYSQNLAVEVKKGLGQKARQGHWIGNPPYGYRRNGDRSLEIEPKEAECLDLAARLYGTGTYSDLDVAQALNDSGYRTRAGKRIARFNVSIWLTNPAYLGKVKYHGQVLDGKVPPIFDEVLFEGMQEVRRIRRGTKGPKPGNRVYLLSGILFCSGCGRRMATAALTGQRYYQCPTRLQKGHDLCEQRAVQADLIEGQLFRLIQDWRIPEDWRQRVLANLNRNEARANAEQRAQRLRRRLARLKVLFLEGDIEEQEYRRQKAATGRELASCTFPTREEVDVMAAAELLTDFSRLWQQATPLERKSLLRSMVERVEVRGKEVVAVRPRPLFAWLVNNLS